MQRKYKANAASDAPLASDLASDGYPSEGNAQTGATIPGPYWHHLVTEAIVQMIEEAGLDPNDDAAQFKDAIVAYVAAQIADINIPVPPTGVTLASVNEHTQNNPPGNEAATPRGVKAMIDRLIDGAPGALNTLNELAAAFGDDADYAGTITTALAGKADLDDVGGGVAGGVVNKSANYQVAAADDGETILVSANGGARTVTLPNLDSGDEGFTVTVVKTDGSANAVTIDGHGGDLVNGAATYALKNQHEAVILKWTGSAWIALGGATVAVIRAALALKANLDSPTLTGIPKAPQPGDDADDAQIATVKHVKDNAGGVGNLAFFSDATRVNITAGADFAEVVSGTYRPSKANAKIGILANFAISQLTRLKVGSGYVPQSAGGTLRHGSNAWSRFLFVAELSGSGDVDIALETKSGGNAIITLPRTLAVFEFSDMVNLDLVDANINGQPNTWVDVAAVTVDVPSAAAAVVLKTLVMASFGSTNIRFLRGTTVLGEFRGGGFFIASSQGSSAVTDFVDFAGSAGNHTYKVQLNNGSSPAIIYSGSYLMADVVS